MCVTSGPGISFARTCSNLVGLREQGGFLREQQEIKDPSREGNAPCRISLYLGEKSGEEGKPSEPTVSHDYRNAGGQ